ncbi:MAG: hypothetical protein HYZ68_01200 [Chloroflexi bacterium]|nr:hypothetical protein [Chloroflexota bacterium]
MAEATSVLTKKILLLDEGLHLVYSLRPHLSLQSYSIQRVASPPEALALLHQEAADLLITNVRTSRANHDLSALTEIRTREPSLPMILMAPEEMEALAQQLGVYAYFRQPFSLLKLVETVREVLEGARPSAQEDVGPGPAASVEELATSPPPMEGRNEEESAAPLGVPTRIEPLPEADSPPVREVPAASVPAPGSPPKRESARPTAAARAGVPTLSAARLEAISEVLSKLRSDIGARCILLADLLGNPLTAVGIVNRGLNTTTLLSLLAGSYATILEMSRRMGEERTFNLNYHEGERMDIYSSNLGRDYLLAVIIERNAKASPSGRALGPRPMGMVWLYAKRALLELMTILSQPEAEVSTTALDEEFSASLRTELEGLFAAEVELPSSLEPEPPAPPRNSNFSSGTEPEDRTESDPGGAPSSLSFQEARERGLIPHDLLAELDPPEPQPPKEKGHAS